MSKKLVLTFLSTFIFSAFANGYSTLGRVDQQYQAAAKKLAIDLGDKEALEQARENSVLRAQQSRQPAEHWAVPAEGGDPLVNLYLYKPKNIVKNAPVIYYIHGGGYILGNARMNGDNLQKLADRQNAVVVSLEYRLASEAPFPADLHDAYRGLSYIYANARKHDLDKNRVVIMGESAGGGLAARLAIYTRDKSEFKPQGLILAYPMLDHRTGTSESPYETTGLGEFGWTANANRTGWTALRGGRDIPLNEMPYYSPSVANNLSGLPPTFIAVGDLDLFVNEDIEFANKLVQSGVPVELHVLPGIFHSFDKANPDAEKSKEYINWRSNAITKMLTP